VPNKRGKKMGDRCLMLKSLLLRFAFAGCNAQKQIVVAGDKPNPGANNETHEK